MKKTVLMGQPFRAAGQRAAGVEARRWKHDDAPDGRG